MLYLHMDIEALIKKLELFSVCIKKDNTQVFPSFYDLCVCKCDIAKHLSELGAQLHR
jgi:hypothetical protein